MGVMGDQRITPSGWLPPVAPGTEPRQRHEPSRRPAPAPPEAGSQAGWALVLAIGALSLLLLSLGSLFVLTLPCSVGAWVLAARARAAVPGDGGRATAALWLARIGVFAGMAAAIVFIALLASGFDFEQFRDDLEREIEERRDRPSSGGGVRAALMFPGGR
jgi:hypothetical protein